MKRGTEEKKQFDAAIHLVKGFIAVSGMTDKEFCAYMDRNKLWHILDESINWTPWFEASDYIEYLGQGLSEQEKKQMLSRYKSQMTNAISEYKKGN